MLTQLRIEIRFRDFFGRPIPEASPRSDLPRPNTNKNSSSVHGRTLRPRMSPCCMCAHWFDTVVCVVTPPAHKSHIHTGVIYPYFRHDYFGATFWYLCRHVPSHVPPLPISPSMFPLFKYAIQISRPESLHPSALFLLWYISMRCKYLSTIFLWCF